MQVNIEHEDDRVYAWTPQSAVPGKLYASKDGSVFLALADDLPRRLVMLYSRSETPGYSPCEGRGLRLREVEGELTVRM